METINPHHIEQQDTQRIPEAIERTLNRHVVDIAPNQDGRKDFLKQMSGASVGIRRSSIDRSSPPIDVDSLTLFPGRSKVLVGPNGAGKSTVFDSLMERDSAFINTKSGGGASLLGRPIHISRERLRISRLDQEELLGDMGNFTAKEVLENAANYFKHQFPVDWNDPEKYETNIENQEVLVRIDSLVDRITKLFDMDEFLGTRVDDLSGGERTKLSLFMILLSEPDVLLLDEPTNHLDLQSISKLTALFNAYNKTGVSIVSISHVDWFLKEVGNDGVLEIEYDGKSRRLHDSGATFDNHMKNSSRPKFTVMEGNIEWLQRDYSFKVGEEVISSPPQFSIENSPLHQVSLPSIHGGDLVILSGSNGSGKTKLIEALINGRGSDLLPHREKGVQVAYLPQFWPEELANCNVDEFFDWVKEQASPLSTGSSIHPHQSPKNLFSKLAREVSFGGKSNMGESWTKKPLSKFSGGEQRLLWFLIVSSLRSIDVLVLDEPTNHMDRNLQEKIAKAIQSFKGTVILSTHDKNLLALLTKEGGEIQGMIRQPNHLILEKNNGKTTIRRSTLNPMAYLDDITRKAKQKARQFKF